MLAFLLLVLLVLAAIFCFIAIERVLRGWYAGSAVCGIIVWLVMAPFCAPFGCVLGLVAAHVLTGAEYSVSGVWAGGIAAVALAAWFCTVWMIRPAAVLGRRERMRRVPNVARP